MRTNLLLVIILGFSFAFSCSEDPIPVCCAEPKNHVVKFKEGNEYLVGHVYVMLNKDKSEVLGYPDKAIVNKSAFDYYKGYYLNMPDFGINTGYLSMTIESFSLYWDTLNTNAIDHLLIEKDPYAEYYYDETDYLLNHCPECIGKDTMWMAIDTEKFHRLIDSAELEKYLNRVK